MEKSVCRIFTKNCKSTGFFCKIPLSNGEYLKVFIINNHIIDHKYLDNENEIKISINDGKYISSIDLRNKFKYTNKRHDITIINLSEKESRLYEYLELDDNMLYDDGGIYIESSIYILHYPGNLGGNNVVVSYGILKKRFEEEENYDFMNYCSTKSGSSGSQILNILNNKVIGIHKQRSVIGEHNIGAFLYGSIKEFIFLYKNYKQKPKYFINKSKSKEIISFLSLERMNMFNIYNENNDFISKRINNIYFIFNQGLISDVISIKYKNKIIAYKLFLNNYPPTPQGWIPA